MLRKFLKNFKNGQKGFTLIELLVVVAILGVLAAVAIPNIAKFIGSGDVAAANTELASAQTAAAAMVAGNEAPAVDADGVSQAFTLVAGSDPPTNGYIAPKDWLGTYNFLAGGTLDETNPPEYPKASIEYSADVHQFIKAD